MLVPTVCRAVFLLRRDDHRVVRARKWRMTHIAGAFAALPVCCRGDLRSPADDAPHRKRTVGRMISAPTTGRPHYRRDEHCSSAFCGSNSDTTDDRWSSLRRERIQNPTSRQVPAGIRQRAAEGGGPYAPMAHRKKTPARMSRGFGFIRCARLPPGPSSRRCARG